MKLLIDKIIHKFKYAFIGLWNGCTKDHSIQIQWIIAMMVIIVSFFFPLTKLEWMMVLLCCFLVIALEYLNSAIEAIVDLASPQYHPLAKKCKDYAAAGVLVISIVAAMIGCMIYLPYLNDMMKGVL